ncbi:hypothetical protein HHK36_032225 [Tetracentron sinense]|uniref:Uncharacterized protein n=1 Tax=Tetracentron sinense TaxID=13715 RepID=A0A834Y9M6_TETSI|nr:hypothetical protein HHK36_032225 [Tetracentron sinense]
MLVFASIQSFALEKWSGRKCYMVAARELLIIWGDTPEYWRFSDVAELLDVFWLEIHGKMDTQMLSMKTTYAAYLVYKFTEDTYGLGPVEVSVKFVRGGGGGWHTVYMDSDGSLRRKHQIFQQTGQVRVSSSYTLSFPALAHLVQRKRQLPRERGDGWIEIEMGEFFNNRGEDGEVEMSLIEVKGGKSKSGLIIQGIELRPKESK